MHKCLPILLFALCLLPTPTMAEVIVFDDFNDGSLGAEWNVNLTGYASNWTYSETGGSLQVDNITPSSYTSQGACDGCWAFAQLSQNFDPLDDFMAEFDIAWAEEIYMRDMKHLRVGLTDQEGNFIAYASYSDNGWRTDGIARGAIPDYSDRNEWYGQSRNSQASINITRTDGQVEIYWNDLLLHSGTSGALASQVHVWFGYYPYRSYQTATFGSLSIDNLSVESLSSAEATPEPATFILLALSLGSFWIVARRRKL